MERLRWWSITRIGLPLIVLILLAAAVLVVCQKQGVRLRLPGEQGMGSQGPDVAAGAPREALQTATDPAAEQKAPPPATLADPRIVVHKADRRLQLFSGDDVVRSYRIGLGSAATGDKIREGDGRTPEGEFYVCFKNPRSRYHLSLGLSYPNDSSAERGLRDGLITQAQHDEIIRAIQRKTKPPWNTPLGGEIFIHGRGSNRDWTRGCIALDDGDISELYELVPVGTPVVIEP